MTALVPSLPEDPYGTTEPEQAREVPPRMPKVGDMITSAMSYKFADPSVIVAISGDTIEVRSLDDKPCREHSLVRLKFHDLEMEADFLMAPEGDRSTVLGGGYGVGDAQWVFADDPRVRFVSILERQLHALALRKVVSFLGVRDESHIPPCESCQSWPCKAQPGCPDYAAILKQTGDWKRPDLDEIECAYCSETITPFQDRAKLAGETLHRECAKAHDEFMNLATDYSVDALEGTA